MLCFWLAFNLNRFFNNDIFFYFYQINEKIVIMSKQEIFEGFVLFVPFDKHSKSEHLAPVLLCEQGVVYKLSKPEDNPFMHESIQPFHGKYCRVEGEPAVENSSIIISKIEEIPDPIINAWHSNKDTSSDDVTIS